MSSFIVSIKLKRNNSVSIIIVSGNIIELIQNKINPKLENHCHCSLSILPENIRKPLVFWSFQGYRKRPAAWNEFLFHYSIHAQCNNNLKLIENKSIFEVCLSIICSYNLSSTKITKLGKTQVASTKKSLESIAILTKDT